MARDAVDPAAAGLGRPVPASCSHEVPLLGANGWRSLHNSRDRLAQRSGLDAERVTHLLGRFGTETGPVLDLIAGEPALGWPLPGAENYLAAEARWAVTADGALHLDDVLTRRTRISIETSDRGLAALSAVAELMAPALGWSSTDVAREVAAYRARVEAERRSQEQPTDETADFERLAAADPRMSRPPRVVVG
jgi:glycerol-3-phosphate dehydrogenase